MAQSKDKTKPPVRLLTSGSSRMQAAAREVIKKGGRAWNAWKSRHTDIHADLSNLDLRGVDLSDADLAYTTLCGSKFRRANLRNALIADADLSGADFSGADLSRARLYESSLRNCKFRKAILSDAVMFWSNISGADFSYAQLMGTDLCGVEDPAGANFDHSVMGWTILGDINLSGAKGLETVIHEGPSVIGIDTIYQSRGHIPKVFLLGAGVPDDFIEFIPSLTTTPVDLASCFISYSIKDRSFCDRLVRDLRASGVRIWYFPENAGWGESVWGEIDRAISHYDKLVIVCSKNSLRSGPVLREMERALIREDRTGTNVIFPIRIDDFVFSKWEHPRKADVLNKVCGDFRGWEKDPQKYQNAFKKFLPALRPNRSVNVSAGVSR